VLQFYFYIDKKAAVPKGILLILSLIEKKNIFKNIISSVEKPTKCFLKHFHFQKDANIVSSPFFPLCISGAFQVIEKQHFELKVDEQKGDRVVPYTYFSFSLNKYYKRLLRSPVHVLKSFLIKILILIQ